jgi:integrase/recombinase XerD
MEEQPASKRATPVSELPNSIGNTSETASELSIRNEIRNNNKQSSESPSEIEVNWEDPSLGRWMNSITRDSTRRIYRAGFKRFSEFTKLQASQLIDEALADQKRDQREKQDIVKQRLISFYSWLIKEASKREPQGRDKGKVGLSSKIAHTYVGAIRSFYATYEIFIKFSGRSKLPKAKVENPRMIVSNLQVKKLLDHTRTARDKAIILTMFQGGMDVSTLCSLKQKDFKDESPLKLELQRPKTGVDYFTFVGRDAVEAIKVYLADAKSRGIQLSSNDPLFLKESTKTFSKEGITPNLVQKMLRDAAIRSGLVAEDADREVCPLNPHALRESFGSILSNHGVGETVIDFWLGHEEKGLGDAYKRHSFEDLKKLYSEKEPLLSIGNGSELEKKLKLEIEEKSQQLQTVINDLQSENYTLKTKVENLTAEHQSLSRQIEGIQELLTFLDPLIMEHLEWTAPSKGFTVEEIQKIKERQKAFLKNLKP